MAIIEASRKNSSGRREVDIMRHTSVPAVTDDTNTDVIVGTIWEKVDADGKVEERYECTSAASGAAAWVRIAPDNVMHVITDPGNAGAIPATQSGSCKIVSAGAETRTLAIPTFAGQKLSLYMDTDGGDCVITSAQRINVAGNTTITLNDAGDIINLEAIRIANALRWQVVLNTTATLG